MRTFRRALVAVAAILLVQVCTLPALSLVDASFSTDWPMFHHDSTHSGYTNSTVPTIPLAQVWNRTIGVDVLSSPESPSVVNGYIYVGDGDHNVYCFKASTGAVVWSYPTGNYVDSSPAVIDSHVYVGSSDGNVYCLDASTGTKIWNYTVGGGVGSPAVVGGYVYVGSTNGNAYCLDAGTGAKLWNYTTEYNYNGPSHNFHWGNSVSDPAVAYERVYVGSSDFDVFCLDASTGVQIWNFTTDAEVYSSPTVADGCVLAGSYDGNVYCLNASDGSELWSFPAGVFSPTNAGGGAGSPVVADGIVYAVGNGAVYALGMPSTPSNSSLIVVAVTIAAIVIVAVVAAFVYYKFFRIKKGSPSPT
jgi:outer membrane protein assembly factor BamB